MPHTNLSHEDCPVCAIELFTIDLSGSCGCSSESCPFAELTPHQFLSDLDSLREQDLSSFAVWIQPQQRESFGVQTLLPDSDGEMWPMVGLIQIERNH